MASTDAHEGEPVPLSAALDALRTAGLAGSSPDRAAAGKPDRAADADPGVDADADPRADARAATPGPAARWPDGPGRVLERIDALSLSGVEWDRDAVLGAVRRVADLAHLEHTRINIVSDPSEFPVDSDAVEDLHHDVSTGPPLRLGWVRHLGVLADRRNVQRLRDWSAAHRDAPDPSASTPPAPGPGYVLHAHTEAGFWMEGQDHYEGICLAPVSDLVEAYAGFMLGGGASGWDHDWFPRDGLLEEFGTELEIGRLLTDAFCAGLGYLTLVDDEISIARRPALRVLEHPGIEGRPRFHHDAGPAVEFADASGLYFLEGVPFPGWMHRAIVDGALTMRYVRDFTFQASRIAAYPSMPPTALLDGLTATLLDVGRKGTYLYRIEDLPDHHGPVWYMVMTDPSTGREYGEFVPPEIGARGSADAAQAAAWGISLEDYLRMTLEG